MLAQLHRGISLRGYQCRKIGLYFSFCFSGGFSIAFFCYWDFKRSMIVFGGNSPFNGPGEKALCVLTNENVFMLVCFKI